MTNENPRGTNSIFILALRTLPHLKGSWINFLTPFIFSVLAFFSIFFSEIIIQRDQLVSVLGNLLQFNGAILGLLLAGFGIYTSVPTNQRTLFSITNAPKDGKFSFYKYRLLAIFKMAFWSLLCTTGIVILYVGLSLRLFDAVPISADLSLKLKVSLSVAIAALLQAKVIVELKVYVFSIYTKSINESRMLAQEHKLKPFDDSID